MEQDAVTTSVSPETVTRWRAHFPILDRLVNGRPLVYLDHAATAQRPEAVLDAVARFSRVSNANIHRGVHTLATEATDAYDRARARVAGFVGAVDPREIVFTRGTTEALNLVAYAWARPRLAPGDEILATEMEHHANIVPWQLVAKQAGAVVRAAPITDDGRLDLPALKGMIGPRTRVVAVGHVSNVLGTVNPVAEIAEAAHAVGAVVAVDGAQAVAHGPVDVRALGADLYAFSGHKMCGPTGIGALWGRYDLLEQMEPWQGGGDMILEVSFQGTTFKDPPTRFEAGTPNIAGAIGLAAAIDFLEGIGWEAIEAHERALLDRALAGLATVEGVRVFGPTQGPRAPVVPFLLEGVHPHDIGQVLDAEMGIAVRVGQLCAEPLVRRLGAPAVTRASFAFTNTLEEVDRLIEAVRACGEMFR
jgi:cysteine desulfurase/selenocysteine lyase